jgi:plastocyanin
MRTDMSREAGSGFAGKKIIILSLGILLIAAACNKTTTQDNSNQAVQSGEVTISMTSSGFIPDTVTVKSGTKVTFVNNDSTPHWPASDPHPIHNGLAGFDALKGLVKGESYSFTFTKAGSFGFHDHLNPSSQGIFIGKLVRRNHQSGY